MSPIASDPIVELANAFRKAKVLLSAVELDVFSALAEKPLTADALRQKIGIHDRGARDFFDTLVALRLLVRNASGRYANAPSADHFLVPGRPSYIGGLLNHMNHREYPSWGKLTAALRTGRAQFGSADKGTYLDLYAEPAAAAEFAAAMTGATILPARELARKFPWGQHKTFIDIGTAEGCLPVEIARAHSHLKGGGFDLPAVAPSFDAYVSQHRLSDRLRFFPGDFLQDTLPSADVLVMGRVLHNWDLATKKLLLAKAFAALSDDGAIILYERLIDNERTSNAAGLLGSLNMLIMTTGGFDYSADDCAQWLHEAGFRNVRVEALTGDQTSVFAHK